MVSKRCKIEIKEILKNFGLHFIMVEIVKNVMNGIEVLDKIKAYDTDIPVIMLSAQDKIEVAVNCMHHQAFDYVVKSETAFIRLQKIISTIFQYGKMEKKCLNGTWTECDLKKFRTLLS